MMGGGNPVDRKKRAAHLLGHLLCPSMSLLSSHLLGHRDRGFLCPISPPPEFKRRPAPEFRYRDHWRHRGWECCLPNFLKFPPLSFSFRFGPNGTKSRPLSVPFLLRTSGKGHSHSQSGSTNKVPNFNFQKSQLYRWIEPVPHSHVVLKGSRCISWSGGLTRRNGKTNQMKTNSLRNLKSICVVTPISLREDKSYLTTWTLKRLG